GLVKTHGDYLEYKRDLAQTSHSLGVVLWNMGRKDEALTTLLQASEQLRAVLKAFPNYARSRRTLTAHYDVLAKMQRAVGKLDDAVATCLERAKLWPKGSQDLFKVAREVAETAGRVGKGKATLSAREQEQRDRYAEIAVDLLRQAVTAGFKNGKSLQKDAEFEALRSREDFQEIVAKLTTGVSSPK